jgi:hypothetical protein
MSMERRREEPFDVQQDQAQFEKAILDRNLAVARALDRLKEECRAELRSAIGPERVEAYEAVRRETKKRLAELGWRVPRTRASLHSARNSREEILLEANRALAGQGLDPKRLDEIVRKYRVQARAATEGALALGEAADAEVVASPQLVPMASTWSTYAPPYQTTWRYGHHYGTRGSHWVETSTNRYSGALFSESAVGIHDADDSDYAYAEAYVDHGFWYTTPTSGMVEAYVFLQAVETRHGGWLTDEFGVSDADSHQFSSVYLRTNSAAARYAKLFEFNGGEDDDRWEGAVAAPGQIVTVRLFSTAIYAAGTSVYCRVGLRDYNKLWVNDMTGGAGLKSSWHLQKVVVRSTGT